MSMEITGNYSSYAAGYIDFTRKTDGTSKTANDYKDVNDYSKHLQEKYSYMNTGTTSISGIPATVSVSGAYLKKCMNNPEEAKKLEENLAAIPDGVNYLKNYVKSHGLGSPVVTYVSYTVDDNGNVTMASGSTNDPDGKIARENAEKAAKEKRDAAKRAEEKRNAKKIEEERIAKKQVENEREAELIEKVGNNEITFSITGDSVRNVSQSITTAFSENTRSETVVGFDVKA